MIENDFEKVLALLRQRTLAYNSDVFFVFFFYGWHFFSVFSRIVGRDINNILSKERTICKENY